MYKNHQESFFAAKALNVDIQVLMRQGLDEQQNIKAQEICIQLRPSQKETHLPNTNFQVRTVSFMEANMQRTMVLFYLTMFKGDSRDSCGSDMGIVWEAYHKGVPLGVPENSIEMFQKVLQICSYYLYLLPVAGKLQRESDQAVKCADRKPPASHSRSICRNTSGMNEGFSKLILRKKTSQHQHPNNNHQQTIN